MNKRKKIKPRTQTVEAVNGAFLRSTDGVDIFPINGGNKRLGKLVNDSVLQFIRFRFQPGELTDIVFHIFARR